MLFGLICSGIGLIHIIFGPRSIPGSVPVNATLDNEDRFYATLFVGFGVAMAWSGRDLAHRSAVFHFLLAVFFAGGLSRLVSIAAVGPPHPLFLILGGVELVMPVLMVLWHRATRATPTA